MLNRILPTFLADLWSHRELLWQFTQRNVELRHKGSHLGLVWSFLNPFLMLGLYVFVFGHIFGGSFGIDPHETRVDYGLGIFIGLSLFHFMSEVLAVSPSLIVSNPNFVKKVVFPLEILPAANVTGALFHLVISLTLALISIIMVRGGLPPSTLWLPIVIFPMILLALGSAWLFSALGVFFRDIGQIMQFLTLGLMFSSGVFYSAIKVPTAAWTYIRFNPIFLAIELARDATLWGRPLNYVHLGYLYVAGIAVCYLGHAAFKRMKPAFADVL